MLNAEVDWVIETQELTRIYGNGENPIRALDGVNLKVAAGDFVSIMGPSGSGKSTLLNMIGALDRPTSGQVFVNGLNLAKIHDEDGFRSRTVGFMFQLHNLIPTLTARENVELPMIGQHGARNRRKRAEELLGLVGLIERQNHLPGQLSGGQRQRVAVARSLANDPPLVLADEPTGSLDTTAGQDLLKLLSDLNQSQRTTFVIVTHDTAVARQTKRVLVMADGKFIHEDVIGSPWEEDLKIWQHSALGQAILSEDAAVLTQLSISQQQRDALRQLFMGKV